MIVLVTVFIAGVCCLKWYWASENAAYLERKVETLVKANQRLLELNRQAHAALSPPRQRPDAHLWGDEVYERIAKDVGASYPPAKTELHLVDPKQAPREAHSHATKGQSA